MVFVIFAYFEKSNVNIFPKTLQRTVEKNAKKARSKAKKLIVNKLFG